MNWSCSFGGEVYSWRKGRRPLRYAHVLATDIEQRYGAKKIGKVDGVIERIYAIAARRKVDNPAVRTILDNAKERFAAERFK